MLRSSSAMARRCSRFLLQTRGIVSSVGGGRGGTASGTRRPSSPSPLPSPPPPPAASADKEEWWAVDGELFKAEKFDPKQILSPLENEHISNKKRRKDRIKHLAQTRLKFRTHGQEAYWAAYMRRYQILRNEWEKLVWDPKPAPKPKSRNPLFVAEETEKYVWRDPRRDAYKVNNQPQGRMDKQLPVSKLNLQNAENMQNMERYPFSRERDAGRNQSLGQGNRMGQKFQTRRGDGSFDTDDELGAEFSWDEDGSETEDEGSEMESDREYMSKSRKTLSRGLSGVGGATRQRIDDHGTEDYFKRLDEDFDTEYSKSGFNSKNNVMGHRSRRYQHETSSSGNDEVDGLQSWSENESESECGSGSGSEEASEVESQQKTGPKKRGWFGHEDDLFKDSDSD